VFLSLLIQLQNSFEEGSMQTLAGNYERTLEICLERIRNNVTLFADQFPFIGRDNSFILGANDHWMTSFWTGQLWLAYAITQDDFFRNAAATHLASFQKRLINNIDISHDLGFLYTLSAIAQYKLTANEQARTLALAAADRLIERFNPCGEYIQAWGQIGDAEEGGRFIVDCLLNLPLLYWATDQTGDPKYADIASRHAHTTKQCLVRPDGSTAHTFFMNPETGEPIGPKTAQGYADDSLWSRGQAWAINGFAIAYQWSGDPDFLSVSQQTAVSFLAEINADYVPFWDFRLPEDALQVRDTSAAVIAAVGLMRLANLLSDETSERYQTAAYRLLAVQLEAVFDPTPTAVQGLLPKATYHATNPEYVEQYTLFGDYFFLEALAWRLGYDVDFWTK
jgi:unsaturated chondroitin disaccharide hydrolase